MKLCYYNLCTCHPEHCSVCDVQAEDGDGLAPLPSLQRHHVKHGHGHVSRVTCHLSSVTWWQVITVTFGGSTDCFMTLQCPHDKLFKESTSHRSTNVYRYLPLLQWLLVMLVAALAPDYHHHSASAGERRGGPRTRPRAAAASGPRQLSLQGRRVTTTLTQPGHGHAPEDPSYGTKLLAYQLNQIKPILCRTWSWSEGETRKGSL